MDHFVSASCGGKCFCGRPVTHKLGEEIPSDEPCRLCGTTFVYPRDPQPKPSSPGSACTSTYHIMGGPTAQRHNLTAYVCCLCFTKAFGGATGCPLSEKDQHALDVYKYAHAADDGNIFAPTVELLCPTCDGKLELEGVNDINVSAGCLECKTGCHFANKKV